MALSCGLKTAKTFMTLFNFLFAVCGAAVLGVGIWIVSDTTIINKLASQSLQADSSTQSNEMRDLVSTAAYLLIAVGAVTLLTSACGFYAAFTETACALILYGALVIAIIIAQTTGAILAGVHKGQIETLMKEGLRQSMTKQYAGMPTKTMETNPSLVSGAWNWFMVTYDCCGVNGLNDFTKNHSEYAKKWYDNHRNYSICLTLQEVIDKFKAGWNPVNATTLMKVPASCCKYNSKVFVKNSDWVSYPEHIKNKECPLTLKDVNSKGCFSAMKQEASRYSTALIISAAAVAALEVSNVVITFLLIRAIRKEM